ncbi:MAG: hypothetical protein GY874_17395 [Desulfobacteraceae bacterium]|nr:hypothetical protein [Desulfobacteraceae bacterium]
MAFDDRKKNMNAGQSSGTTFADLRGRQSVRATFRLSNDCIKAISIVSGQMGIKQKSLFDHMLQDIDTLRTVARQIKQTRLQAAGRIQKTYVMSRNALLSLEAIADNFNAPRDVLIEYSVQQLMPLIEKEQKRYSQRKRIFEKIEHHLELGRMLLKESYAELGEDDPVTERLTAVMGIYEGSFKQLAMFMEKIKSIETFEPKDFNR